MKILTEALALDDGKNLGLFREGFLLREKSQSKGLKM